MEAFHIDMVAYYVSFGIDDKYYKEYEELSVSDFYKNLRELDNAKPKTSMPPLADYTDKFEQYLSQGMDILCICLTSKFSGSYSSASMAKKDLEKRYPDRIIEVVDSMQATFVQGILVIEAARMRGEGLSLTENAAIINQLKLSMYTALTVDSLVYLQRGGRIGKASALAGSLLNIKPIIVLDGGELIPFSKIRTRKKAIEKIFEIVMEKYVENQDDYDFYLIHSEAYAEITQMQQTLSDRYGLEISYPIGQLGATIGAHIGPSVVALGCMKKRSRI